MRRTVTRPSGDPWSRLTRIIGFSGLVLGMLVVSVLVVSGLNMPEEPDPAVAGSAQDMAAISPSGVVAPEEVPAALAGHYEGAQTHSSTFEQVPCFCGCQEMLGHRHLGDCFVRADGTGLEAHALGCGVCLGEADQVIELIDSGVTDPAEIRAAVVATWGDPYSTE